MKLPITISIFLFVAAIAAICWTTTQSFDPADKTIITVYISTALGGLISAVFIVYGYFMNLSVFKESQKPKIILQIYNDRRILDETSEHVHQTIIRYANFSQNECRELNLSLSLVGDSKVLKIPSLFSDDMNMGPYDSRDRDFPTLDYFRNNGIPKNVINNLEKYKLRASYSYTFMHEEISSYYDYAWDSKKEWWDIV